MTAAANARAIVVVSLALGTLGCAGGVEIMGRAPSSTPSPMPAQRPRVPVPGCAAEREPFEQIARDLAKAEKAKLAALADPKRPKKPQPKALKKPPPTRSVSLRNDLGSEFALEAVVVYLDDQPVFIEAGETAPPTVVATFEEASGEHPITVRALVKRTLEGGFFDYVAECKEIRQSGTIPVGAKTHFVRRGVPRPAFDEPVTIVLDGRQDPLVRLEGTRLPYEERFDIDDVNEIEAHGQVPPPKMRAGPFAP